MSFPPNPSSEMGTQNRQQTPEEGSKVDPTLHPNDDVPLDLSMPRYPNTTKVPCPRTSYFSAVRNKPPSSYDVDANDQPIDYSKKAFTERESKVDPYGDYAETDLDQPTDYSLRYAEDDTDDEEKDNSTYFAGNEQEDTVKTYCTEGTPYETPLNFSTATSMSDLRLEDAKDVEGAKRTMKKVSQEGRNSSELIACTKEEEEEDEISTKESKNINNELVLNSSSASIEKPVNYYEEGTPGRISRVSSLSSLGDAVVGQNCEVEGNAERNGDKMIAALPVSPVPSVVGSGVETEDGDAPLAGGDDVGTGDETAAGGDEEEKGDAVSVDKEGKVVTFGGEDHYAEQTPLMFSRSSSLGSLSGFEQQSIHDDRSSIVSDFSRRTSGVVSPSELPDSPSQTVPPSPRHNQRVQTSDFSPQAPPLRQFPYVKSPRAKCSVFEDNTAAFKEESTPIEFSAATSLSSLTIDDEPKILVDSKENPLNVYAEKARTLGRSSIGNEPEILDRNGNEVANENLEESRDRETYTDQVQVSDGDEDDEDILAACISIGMRTSMYREPLKKNPEIKEKPVHRISAYSATNLVRYQTSSTLDRLEAGISVNSTTTTEISPISTSKVPGDVVTVPTDTVHVYCTEDTPADISPVGSQSNLSALSMSSIHGDFEKDEGNRLSGEEEDNWILTGDDEKILEECILSGIPKAAVNNNSLPGAAVVPEFHSPSRVAPMRKPESPSPRPSNIRGVSSASPPALIENNEIPIHRTSFNTWRDPTESPRRAAHRHSNPYNDCSNQSDDDATVAHCAQSALPKVKTNSLPFVNSTQRTRKPTKPPSRRPRMNEGSSHVVTQVFRGNVTRITITQSHEPEELFTDNSSGSDEEEDLILAQCIRSGMPKA